MQGLPIVCAHVVSFPSIPVRTKDRVMYELNKLKITPRFSLTQEVTLIAYQEYKKERECKLLKARALSILPLQRGKGYKMDNIDIKCR